MAITPDEISRAKRYEGNVNFFYLDTGGNVTVGCGHLVATISVAASLTLIRKADGLPATIADKQTEWTTIKSKPKGQPASYYAQFCALTMNQPAIDSLLNQDLADAEHQIISKFPNYSSFPQAAKAGLVDMVFNLGIGTLTTNPLYTNFVSAVRARNWVMAANTCHRPNVQQARNTEVQQLFLQAAKPPVTPPHPKPTPPPHPKPTPPHPTPTHTGSGSTGSMTHAMDAQDWLRIFSDEPAIQSSVELPKQIPAIPTAPPMPNYIVGGNLETQSIVAIVAMSSNVTTAAITAITAIASINKNG